MDNEKSAVTINCFEHSKDMIKRYYNDVEKDSTACKAFNEQRSQQVTIVELECFINREARNLSNA
jgi:hypothetical protein